ncbi:hypothetical protein LZ023_27415 [Pseudomonas silvicola]|nr:hypothetical protein LZ023_27415 [Pseudomonas silvicola]
MLRMFLGDRLGSKIGRLAMALVMVVGIAAVRGLVIVLWNWLMPALFAGVRQVDYWQALGLLLLSKILFGGGRGHWKGRRQHWESLSQEEREQLKNHFKNRWKNRFGIDRGWTPAPSSRTRHGSTSPFRTVTAFECGARTTALAVSQNKLTRFRNADSDWHAYPEFAGAFNLLPLTEHPAISVIALMVAFYRQNPTTRPPSMLSIPRSAVVPKEIRHGFSRSPSRRHRR